MQQRLCFLSLFSCTDGNQIYVAFAESNKNLMQPRMRERPAQKLRARSTVHRSALDTLLRIARNEGPGVLWRGTDLSLLVAVPMVAMYFPLYDSLLQRCNSAGMPFCVALCLHYCDPPWLHNT